MYTVSRSPFPVRFDGVIDVFSLLNSDTSMNQERSRVNKPGLRLPTVNIYIYIDFALDLSPHVPADPPEVQQGSPREAKHAEIHIIIYIILYIYICVCVGCPSKF